MRYGRSWYSIAHDYKRKEHEQFFLKHYFTYLEKRGLRWQAVTVDDLADFLAWLKYPRIDEKVIPLNLEPKYRAETINAILDNVMAFCH